MRNPLETKLISSTRMQEIFQHGQKIHEEAEILGKKSIFTIGTTTKKTPNGLPFTTPIRAYKSAVIGGCIVYTQLQAEKVARALDGKVDYILADCEKKIDYSIGEPTDATQHLRSVGNVELGNISSVCFDVVSRSNIVEYKPNDITVNAVWQFISNYFDSSFSTLNAAIIGVGNIGFKLALKLVESGVETSLYRRNEAKGRVLENTINMIKPTSTVARATYFDQPLHACLFRKILIGCSSGEPCIAIDMVSSMAKNGLILDVGKGTLQPGVADYALEQGIQVIRADVAWGLESLVAEVCVDKGKFAIGRKTLKSGIGLVSGGYYGKRYDLVVDNYDDPKYFYGVADGKGDFLKAGEKEIDSLLSTAKTEINLRNFDVIAQV